MGRKRKTVAIEAIVTEVNRRNTGSTCDPEVRRGWNSLLEILLIDANQYGGFCYLQKDEVPKGYDPGIVWANGTTPHSYPKGLKETGHAFPDETRRHYFFKQR